MMHPISSLCALALAAARLASGAAARAEPARHADPVASDLKRLAPLFDRDVARLPEDVALRKPDACPTRLAVAALQYRGDPDAFRNAFFAMLVIDDYEDRADGIYNMMSPSEAASAINDAAAKHPDVTDKRFQSLIGFCAFRDENLWVDSPKGRVSLARVMRGLALSALLAGTDEDPLASAGAIAAYTAASHRAPRDDQDSARDTR